MAQPAPTVTRINFKKAGLPEYDNARCYASIIDNAFTAAECYKLLKDTEREHKWEQAGLNRDGDAQRVDVSYRNSWRILRDDPDCAAYILGRIKPFIEDLELLDSSDPTTAAVLGRRFNGIKRDTKKYRMMRLNERLRFLKYTEGQFFRPHCDGSFTTPDYSESSFVTIQVYLNDSTTGAEVEGGATRFWSAKKDRFYDVEPKMGRVLVFQHHMLIHSGERVESGTKYTIRGEVIYRQLKENEDLDDMLEFGRQEG